MFSQAAIKSRFFANLAQFCSDNASYPAVIHHLQRSPDADVREWASWLAPKAHCGAEASFAWRPDLFGPLDLAMISSAERSGHLSEAFRYLSQYYRFVAKITGQLCYGLLIPALVLLVGTVFLAIIQAIVAGGIATFWMHFGPPVVALGLGVAGIFLLTRWGIHEAARSIPADEFLRKVPAFGKAWQELEESRFALAFSFYLQAGNPLSASLELSGEASRSALLQKAARQVVVRLKKKKTLSSQAIYQQGVWSSLLSNILVCQEPAQQTKEKALQAAYTLQQRATNHIEKLCNQIPKIASFVIILLLLWKIFVLFSHLNTHYTAFLNTLL
jgi:type II secretory pathway component PulF